MNLTITEKTSHTILAYLPNPDWEKEVGVRDQRGKPKTPQGKGRNEDMACITGLPHPSSFWEWGRSLGFWVIIAKKKPKMSSLWSTS